MALKFTKKDDLDKLFEEFASFPTVEKVEFPKEEKEKKSADTQAKQP